MDKSQAAFFKKQHGNPIGSMYGIFTYIYHKSQPNVGKYTIHYMDPLGIFGIVLYRLEYYTTFVGDEI